MKKFFAILLVVGLVFSLAVANAQEEKKPVLTGKIGYFDPAENNLKSSFLAGIDYTLKENPKSAISIGLNYARPKFKVTVLGVTVEEKYTLITVPVTYKMKFVKEGEETPITPYAGIGVDYCNMSNGDSESTVGFHIAVGAEKKNLVAELGYLIAEKNNSKWGGLSVVVGVKF